MNATARTIPFPGSFWSRGWRWVLRLSRAWRSRPEKKLRVSETLQLGERRFLALVECERHKFLIGGTANSIAMLSELKREAPPENPEKNVE